MVTAWNDPKIYRELSAPHKGADAANDALKEFIEAVYKLRKEHRIVDVLLISSVNVEYGDDGTEASAVSVACIGDSNRSEFLAAYAIGQIQAEHREHINTIMSKRPKSN